MCGRNSGDNQNLLTTLGEAVGLALCNSRGSCRTGRSAGSSAAWPAARCGPSSVCAAGDREPAGAPPRDGKCARRRADTETSRSSRLPSASFPGQTGVGAAPPAPAQRVCIAEVRRARASVCHGTRWQDWGTQGRERGEAVECGEDCRPQGLVFKSRLCHLQQPDHRGDPASCF